MMKSNIKVFIMNEYDWVASKLDRKETNEWYKEEYGLDEEENPIEDVRECSLINEGAWCITDDERDFEKLGEGLEVKKDVNMTSIGDLKREGDDVLKFTSFEEFLFGWDSEKPQVIASKEY
ncbi:MAG: hypothetical protein KH415_09555 [Clostridium sp.]|nr:hypothetical protein [Clostridium sp.]